MAYPVYDKRSWDRVPSSIRNTHEYIAVHYLGVDGGENWNLYGGGYGGHATIYLNGTIYLRCYNEATIWAVGASSGFKQVHPYARNMNTFSIEMCCYNENHRSSSSDKTWYFTQATQEACVQLVRDKFKEFGWPLTPDSINEHLLRHGDITTKICPAPYCTCEGYKGSKGTNWTWKQFKEAVRTGVCPHPDDPKPQPADDWYRIRKVWSDPTTQIGAYKDVTLARRSCPVDYTVYDPDGVAVYKNTGHILPYSVRVLIDDLNIRQGPGTTFDKTGRQTGKGVFTIVQESTGKGADLWGKLLSGAGWIALEPEWVQILSK